MLTIDVSCLTMNFGLYLSLKNSILEPTERSSNHVVTLVHIASVMWRFYCASGGLKHETLLYKDTFPQTEFAKPFPTSLILLSIAPGTVGLNKHGFDLKRKINCHSRAHNDSAITVRQNTISQLWTFGLNAFWASCNISALHITLRSVSFSFIDRLTVSDICGTFARADHKKQEKENACIIAFHHTACRSKKRLFFRL